MSLPKHWGTIPFRDLIITQKGKKPQRLSDQEFPNSIPYLDIETLETGVVSKYADRYSTNLATENDIIIVADGSRSGLVFKGVDGAVGSTLLCLTPIKINRDFLFYFLKSKYELFSKNKTGGSIPHLNLDLLFELMIPFPSIEVQVKIVEALKKTWLVFERDFQRKNELVQESLKNELKLKPNVKFSTKHDFGSQFQVSIMDLMLKESPSKPNIIFKSDVQLKEIVENISYGTSKPLNTENVGVPILRIPNLKDFEIDKSDLKFTELNAEEYNKLKLIPGDILMIRSNGSISLLGRSCVVTEEEKGFAFAGYLLRLRVKSNLISPEYLNYCLHSPSVRAQIESIERSSSGVNNINTKEVLNLKINVPNLHHQAEIVKKIKVSIKRIKEVNVENAKLSDSINNLQNSLLKTAYSGSLVKEDSLDQTFDFSEIRNEITFTKNLKLEELKNFKKKQSLASNDIFMNSKDLEKVKVHIMDFTMKNYSVGSGILSETDIQKIKENAIGTFKDFDFDDFSNVFLEMTQEKICENDSEPFFQTQKLNGKISIKIRKQ